MPFSAPSFGPPMGISAMGSLFFVFVIGIMIFILFRRFATWTSNNAADIVTIQARVVAKRSYHHHNGTSYFVTFEFPNGNRREFRVYSDQFGMIAEQDIGILQCQGTRFLAFERRQ